MRIPRIFPHWRRSFSFSDSVRPGIFLTCLLATQILAIISRASAQIIDFDAEPILYSSTPSVDRVASLARRLKSGQLHLPYDTERGYLPALLKELGIAPSSQVLVFSKTSFQRDLIAPQTPRALYFNDDTYVGYVRYGEVLEFASVDPEQGSFFYTMSQDPASPAGIVRRDAECLQCHASALTKGVPGVFVRSVYSDASGQPVLRAGTFLTDHTSPLKQRWGGWYVTGTHGSERHLGNSFLTDTAGVPEAFNPAPGANLIDLKTRFSTTGYLSEHSDIVALMVMEHQTQLHNLVTAANYQARLALRDQVAIRELTKEPEGPLTEATRRRFDSAARPLLKYCLFVDETPLLSPIRGTSSFAEEFQARGPRDRKGRSLRELDLTYRLFRYPMTYLIYWDGFKKLPEVFRDHFYERLRMILLGRDTGKDFARIPPEDREAVYEILLETKEDLPESWRSANAGKPVSSGARARL